MKLISLLLVDDNLPYQLDISESVSDSESILMTADKAMYISKEKSGNLITVYQ